MEKVNRPTGLIRYESLNVLNGREGRALYKRPRVWVYSAVLLLALSGIGYGLTSMAAIEIRALHERQPLFVLQSDGSVQNKYTIKVLNKLTEDIQVNISARGPAQLLLVGADKPVTARRGKVTARTVFVRVPRQSLTGESSPITFHGEGKDSSGTVFSAERESVFIGPRH